MGLGVAAADEMQRDQPRHSRPHSDQRLVALSKARRRRVSLQAGRLLLVPASLGVGLCACAAYEPVALVEPQVAQGAAHGVADDLDVGIARARAGEVHARQRGHPAQQWQQHARERRAGQRDEREPQVQDGLLVDARPLAADGAEAEDALRATA